MSPDLGSHEQPDKTSTRTSGHHAWLRWLWLFVFLLAAAAGVAWYLQMRAAPQGGPTAQQGRGGQASGMPVPVIAAAARRTDFPIYLDGIGSVAASYTVTVRARIDGQLTQVYYQEGQQVRAGDLLAEIDPRPFEVQLEQAEGQMARDRALLENARVDVERYRTLVAQDAAPEQQLETQISTVRQYEGVVKTDQAAIDNARLQLSYCRITSPIGGRVGLRQIDPGNMVHASDQSGLLIIAAMQPIAIFFSLPEDSLPPVLQKLRRGASLPVEAYNRDRSRKLASGRLLTIDNQIDPSTGTVRLKALFENADLSLFPNQFVNVRLLVDVQRRQITVPSVSIQRGAQGTYVYVVKADNSAEFRSVAIGTEEGGNTAISRGVAAGERVVTDGADKLQPGSRVALRTERPTTIPGPSAPASASSAGAGQPPGAERSPHTQGRRR
jgi:membrane fusion protein, multidrug efflux system